MNDKVINVEKCPICTGSNACCRVEEAPPNNCWCYEIEFPQAIFELVPDEQIGKSCICKNCLNSFEKV